MFRTGETLNANAVDIIAIETLRVFEPSVYQELSKLKNMLTHNPLNYLNQDERKKQLGATIEGLIAKSKKPRNARHLIIHLFSAIEWAFNGMNYSGKSQEEWTAKQRICSRDTFDRYFILAIPEDDISKEDMDRIVNAGQSYESLMAEFSRLEKVGLLPVAIDRLDGRQKEIPLGDPEPFMRAILDVSDRIPEDSPYNLLGKDHDVTLLIHQFLARVVRYENRIEAIKKALQNSLNLLPVVAFVELENAHTETCKKDKRYDEILIKDEDLAQIKTLCLEKILAAANNGELARHPRMASILYSWTRFAGVDSPSPKEWVAKLIESNVGFLSFLRSIVSIRDYGDRKSKTINLKALEDFISLEAATSIADKLDPSGLTEVDAEAVRAFRITKAAKAAGRDPDHYNIDSDKNV